MRRIYLLAGVVAALLFAVPALAAMPGQLCTATAATVGNCGVNDTAADESHVQLVRITDGDLAGNVCTGGTDEMICFCEGVTCVPAADDGGLGVLPTGAVDWAEIADAMTLDASTTIAVGDGEEFTYNAAAQTGTNTAVISIILDQADDADTTDVVEALRIELGTESQLADAADTLTGIVITAENGVLNGVIDAAIVIDNEETLTATLADGILVSNTGAHATGITDGLDVSVAGIVNAVNIGDNLIMGTDDSLSVGATDDTVILDSNDSAGVYTCTDADANAACHFEGGGTGGAILGVATNLVAQVITDDLEVEVNSNADRVASLEGITAGPVTLDFRGYGDSADDDMGHTIFISDTVVGTTDTEEVDFEIQIASAQADGAGAGGSAPVERLKIWSANGQHDITSNTVVVAGMYAGSTQIQLTDFDAGNQFGVANDGDPNAEIGVECTTMTTNAEDCDLTLSVQEAGLMEARITIDADGGIDVGTALNADVTLITSAGSIVADGNLTIPTEATGGNAGAKNEFIGLPRIAMAALGAMGDGPNLSEPLVPTVALCAPVGGGAEADDAAIYRDTLTDVTSYRHTFVGAVGLGEGFDCDFGPAPAALNYASVGFWLRSTVAFTDDDLEINLLDAAVVEGDGDLPAYTTPNVWQWMEVDVAADCGAAACADIDGVELLTTAVDPTIFNDAVIYMDNGAVWIAACEETLGAEIPYDGVLSLLAGVTAGGNTSLLVEWTNYFVHYQAGNDAVCMIDNQSAAYGMALYAY